ncbi:MAG: DMT family transporter [Acidimicrobiia bacterium]
MTSRILSTSDGTNRQSFSAGDWGLFWSISVIWGASFLLMDIGLDAFQPGLVTLLRVGLGAAVLWLFPKARSPINRADWPRLIALSVIWVAIPFSLFPIAQQWINSAVAGMLNGAVPIFAAAIGSLMLRRLPRGMQLAGIAVGFLGVVAIASPSLSEGSSEALGVGLVVLAAVCYGLAITIATPIQQRYGSLPVMARMLGLASLWTAPLGVWDALDSSWRWDSFISVAVAGFVGTGLAFVIMGTLTGRVGGTRASIITYVIPVVALGLGVVFRGDVVGVISVVGVGLVIIGALLASRREV